MFEYQIDFSKYKLRDYEKELALREFENQFPTVRDKSINESGISFTTNKLLDEQKLKKLTFYSEFHYQNGQFEKISILTDQTLVENCRKSKQKDLFEDIKPNKTREVRYLTHSAHEYKGRFYPQLAKAFMNYACIKKGDTVLDPFCGSGTTLVESFLFGANAIGVDINPIAFLLAKAKVKSLLLEQKDLMQVSKSFGNLKENYDWEEIKFKECNNYLDIEYLQNWFPEHNLKKIILIQNIIKKLPTETAELFAKVVLSNMLKEFSFQDPSQLRIRRRPDAPPENLIETFKKNLNEQIEILEKFQSLNRFKLNSNVQNYLGDVRSLMESTNLNKNSIDVVITSPPYATALPYVDTDRLSLFAFGYTDRSSFRKLEKSLIGNREITKSNRLILDKELESNFKSSVLPKDVVSLLKKIYLLNVNSDVGFRRKNTAALLYKYFMDMRIGIEKVSYVLKKGKLAFFVVGNNRTTAGKENINIATDDFIGLIAEQSNFELIEKISMSVQKGYMIHSKNSINTESILILQRK
ncbi:DNA methyltransferase [Candidatus Spongiihabitans sp.]|uniref:TRM11 family SAM-dependent methyltransferase n=1 Tax=Candidatus Spongiihabitans sp. TaxID=3101308 RepID=UPI003C7DE279